MEIQWDFKGFLKGLHKDGFHRIVMMILKGFHRIVMMPNWSQCHA